MKNDALPRLYLITDGLQRGGREEEEELLGKIETALKGGARAIQLREPKLTGGELLRLAKKLRILTDYYDARLFINERVDIALIARADGVHLRASSFPPSEARKLLGKEKLIGVSTHSLEQAQRAEAATGLGLKEGADFITLGPVFHTPSKAGYGEPLGIDNFRKITGLIEIPVYALGGVRKDNVEEVLKAGAYGAAVISEIMQAGDNITKTTEDLLTKLRQVKI